MAEYATNPEHKDFLLRITSATEEGKVGEREREREGGGVSDREREREVARAHLKVKCKEFKSQTF